MKLEAQFAISRFSRRATAFICTAVVAYVPLVASSQSSASAMPTAAETVVVEPVPPAATSSLVDQSTAPMAVREDPDRADDVASLVYADPTSAGNNVGQNIERLMYVSLGGGDIEWSLHDANDRPMPLLRLRHDAFPSRVAAVDGARYNLVFRNRSTRAYEVVATVDGRDVLNGETGSFRQRGYVVMPLATLIIRGFRLGSKETTPFRFMPAPVRLAEQLPVGDAQNVGVLGVAVFKVTLQGPDPFPGDPVVEVRRRAPLFPWQ